MRLGFLLAHTNYNIDQIISLLVTLFYHLKNKEFGLDEHRNFLSRVQHHPNLSGTKRKHFLGVEKKISLRKTCFELFASDLDVEKLLPETKPTNAEGHRGGDVCNLRSYCLSIAIPLCGKPCEFCDNHL